MNATIPPVPAGEISGILHTNVAFDWGSEINLQEARRRVPAEPHALPRRSRTPSSVTYEPAPLRFRLANIPLQLESLGEVSAESDVTVFDFGVASVSVHVPFRSTGESIAALAGSLSEPAVLIERIRAAATPLFEKLKPAILGAEWSDLGEEYFVFQLSPGAAALCPENLREQHAGWLASLVRLETDPLSAGEIAEALRLHLSYGPRDLFVADWAAAVIVDDECDEILEAIAFANLQLLEFRHIDRRLDSRVQETYELIRGLAKKRLPFWRTQARPIRALGELKVEANVMLERTSDALKLVGDPYLARAYQLLAARLHLKEWGENVRRSIAVLESTYQVVSDQGAAFRMELLEAIIVVLIVLEIVLAFVRH